MQHITLFSGGKVVVGNRTVRSEELLFVPDTAGARASDTAINIIIVLDKGPIIANDTFVNHRGELAMKDLPVSHLTAFLVRIGHKIF